MTLSEQIEGTITIETKSKSALKKLLAPLEGAKFHVSFSVPENGLLECSFKGSVDDYDGTLLLWTDKVFPKLVKLVVKKSKIVGVGLSNGEEEESYVFTITPGNPPKVTRKDD